jgi:hypothetical protein
VEYIPRKNRIRKRNQNQSIRTNGILIDFQIIQMVFREHMEVK